MRLPGFTAQATLGPSHRHLSGQAVDMQAEAGLVVPAADPVPHWGDFKQDQCTKKSDCNPDGTCVGNGLRQFSAILWDIPWGVDWKTFCKTTIVPAVINGQIVQRVPDRCNQVLFNMWGEFDIPDPTCTCGSSYPVCWQQGPASCRWGSISACSLQQAQATCAWWGCRVNSYCNDLTGRCS
jgi:hypothetical protein